MKKLSYIFLLVCLISCDSEKADECFKTAGDAVTRQFDVDYFNQIRVEGDLQLVLREGSEQLVLLKTGENIVKQVKVEVQDSLLVASYADGCNLAREYGVTQLIVVSPFIKKIRNASIYDVTGEGVFSYPDLTLESNTLTGDSGIFYNNGGFILNLDANRISLQANGKAFFKLTGKTQTLIVNFADKTARLEGSELIAQRVEIFHRSANDVIVNPRQSLEGIITGPGDIISVNRPPEVNVNERFTGKLIFKNP